MGLTTFDLDAYMSKYAGLNRIRHLMFILEESTLKESGLDDDGIIYT